MTLPLLTTKLYIPPVRPELVPRPRLVRQLNEGLFGQSPSLSEGRFARKLTLISAPAGFGKTTLLSEWVADFGLPISDFGLASAADLPAASAGAGGRPKIRVAWLSLDKGDNDPARFLAYLTAAFQTVEENVGKGIVGALQPPQPPPTNELLTALINQIDAIPGASDPLWPEGAHRPFILILDDYHLITAQAVHDALIFLLDHLPAQLHLVIATRADPPLPLTRLRGRGQLTELRQLDLRFTTEEVAQFLNQVIGLELSADDVAALTSHTEGWIAGLQMAAVSMQGRDDITAFVRALTGSHRHILDYLIEQVLQRQPASIQTFLLQTSILDRLTGPLCDAVVESANQQISKSASQQPEDLQICRFADLRLADLSGQEALDYLERNNLFVVPLDDERRWYRYHHLFADLLRQRLQQIDPGLVPTLHGRASAWYERNGLTTAAIDHALSAGDFEWAAHLLDEHTETLWGRGEQITLSRFLQTLPGELVRSWPRLCIYRAFLLFLAGQLDAAEQWLQAAERALGSTVGGAAPPRGPGQSYDRNRAELQGMIAAVRAYIVFFRGDVPAIIQFSRQALEYLPEEKSMWRGAAASVLGDAHSLSGDLKAANRAYGEAVAISKAAGNTYFVLLAGLKLAVNEVNQGRLHQGSEMCRQQLELVQETGFSKTARAGGLLAVWGTIVREWNDLDRAMHYVQQGLELSKRGNNVVMLGVSYFSLQRVLFAKGDLAGAEQAIRQLEKLALESNLPLWLTSPTAAWKARIWVAQGRLEAAGHLLRERGLDAGDDLAYPCLDEYLSLARLFVARSRSRGPREQSGEQYLAGALDLLSRLRQVTEKAGLVSKDVETLVLQALAFQAQGHIDRAMAPLKRALALARPEGYVRVFLDEGDPLAKLLEQALARGIAVDYVSKLLAPTQVPKVSDQEATETNLKPETQEPETPWIEPLSERELQVLRLLSTGLSSTDIAEELSISVNTVRSHVRSIYGKLDVHSRYEAVARAKELGLL